MGGRGKPYLFIDSSDMLAVFMTNEITFTNRFNVPHATFVLLSRCNTKVPNETSGIRDLKAISRLSKTKCKVVNLCSPSCQLKGGSNNLGGRRPIAVNLRGKQKVYGFWTSNKEMTPEGSTNGSKRFSLLMFGAFLSRAQPAFGWLRAGKKRPV